MKYAKNIGLVFGPNGAGKGTLAEKLTEEFDFQYVNMGNIIRDCLHHDAKFKRKYLHHVNEGDLLGDDVIEELIMHFIEHFIHRANINKDILFDGFPRTKAQIKILKDICDKYHYNIKWIVSLNISLDEVLHRLTQRVVAPDGHVYHLTYNPPPAHFDKKDLIQRKDDRPHVVKKRYEDYMVNTLECLSDEFIKDVPICNIDATHSISNVHDEALSFVLETEKELKKFYHEAKEIEK